MTARVSNRILLGTQIDYPLGRVLVLIDGDNLQKWRVDFLAFASWLAWKFRVPPSGFVDLHLFKTVWPHNTGAYHRRLGDRYLVHETPVESNRGYRDEELRRMMYIRLGEYDTLVLAGSDSDFTSIHQRLRAAGKTVITVYSESDASPWLHMWSDYVAHIEDYFAEWPDPEYTPRQ